tara:strand:- start:14788 stop:15219 length:432 start_codon:yes stop_codon:yes gene_type:complete
MWQALLQLGFINHPDGHHYAIQLLESNFTTASLGIEEIRQSGYINQLSQILLPVLLGLGFTVIPQSCLDAFPTPDRIRSADLRVPIKETVYLITKKHRPLPARYPMIRELLAAQWPQRVWLRCGKLGQRFANALPPSLRFPPP